MYLELSNRTMIGLNMIAKKAGLDRNQMIKNYLTALVDFAIKNGEIKEPEIPRRKQYVK